MTFRKKVIYSPAGMSLGGLVPPVSMSTQHGQHSRAGPGGGGWPWGYKQKNCPAPHLCSLGKLALNLWEWMGSMKWNSQRINKKNDCILTRCQIWGNIGLRLLNKQNYKWYNVHQFINCPDDTLAPYPNRLRHYLWSMPHKLKSTCSGHQIQYRAFLSTVHQAHARPYQNFKHFKMVLIWLNAKKIRN